jgi:hypothetical protein
VIRFLVLAALLLAGCAEPLYVQGLRPLQAKGHWWDAVPSPDTLRPTLRWEPLRDDPDRRVIGYDLRVWRAASNWPPGRPDRALVYRRDALPDAAHQLETALEPRTEYVWTVRARVEIDGATRVTEWSRVAPRAASGFAGRGRPVEPVMPDPGYFVFRTPRR